MEAVATNQLFDPKDEPKDFIKQRKHHIQRIAWFVKNGWHNPIDIDVGIPGRCHVGHLITDGNHRAAAAIFRDETTILANVSGEVNEIDSIRSQPK